jgi:hypothetical protein
VDRARSVVVNGNIAYVGAGSSGLVVVDVTNRTAPKVLTSVAMPGTAVRVAYSAGKVFVAAWNDARVYDVSAPLHPLCRRGAIRRTSGSDPVTARTLGVAGFGDVMFVGNWFVPSRIASIRTASPQSAPESAHQIDFGGVPAGTSKTMSIEILNQDGAPLTLTNNSVDGKSFTVEPTRADRSKRQRQAVGHLPPHGQRARTGRVTHCVRRSVEPVRTARLFGNRPGLGIGDPMPEMRVRCSTARSGRPRRTAARCSSLRTRDFLTSLWSGVARHRGSFWRT